jgi:hypothetical protein
MTWPSWRTVLPILQAALAVCLWLYIPVQERKEILQLQGLPTEHPFRNHPWRLKSECIYSRLSVGECCTHLIFRRTC